MEEKERVNAVEEFCGLGWGSREMEEKCGKGKERGGKREEKGSVNAVEESRGRNGSDVENRSVKVQVP